MSKLDFVPFSPLDLIHGNSHSSLSMFPILHAIRCDGCAHRTRWPFWTSWTWTMRSQMPRRSPDYLAWRTPCATESCRFGSAQSRRSGHYSTKVRVRWVQRFVRLLFYISGYCVIWIVGIMMGWMDTLFAVCIQGMYFQKRIESISEQMDIEYNHVILYTCSITFVNVRFPNAE